MSAVSEIGVRRSEIGDRTVATTKPSVGGSDVAVESSARGHQSSSICSSDAPSSGICPPTLRVALLTAGRDKPYALGMAAALTSIGIAVDFIGSDQVVSPELLKNPRVRFLNYRDQRSDAGLVPKMLRVTAYYWRLIRYAATTEAKTFHILW